MWNPALSTFISLRRIVETTVLFGAMVQVISTVIQIVVVSKRNPTGQTREMKGGAA
jgi:hypothetical protein